MNKTTPLDPRLIKEAAAWLAKLNSGSATLAEHQAHAKWRNRSPSHERAWELAQRLTGSFNTIPDGLKRIDDLVVSHSRRRTIRALCITAGIGGTYALGFHFPWREWTATYRTAIGERKSFVLADGIEVLLNTASAVDTDPSNNRIWLRAGQLLVKRSGGLRAAGKSLIIDTPQGSVEVVGSRCAVQDLEGLTRVVALAGSVIIQHPNSNSGKQLLRKGQACIFSSDRILAFEQASPNDELWQQGLIFASSMRLIDFVSQLARNHVTLMRCESEIANLRISGIYQVDNLDQILIFLTHAYPITVRKLTRYCVLFEARGDVV